MKEAKKLAAHTLVVKESQRKVAEVYEAEVQELTKVNRDNLSTEYLIKLGEKLKEAMGMKQNIVMADMQTGWELPAAPIGANSYVR